MNIPNDQPVIPPEPQAQQLQPQMQMQMQIPQQQLEPQIQPQPGEIQPQLPSQPELQQPERQSLSEQLTGLGLQPRIRPHFPAQVQAQLLPQPQPQPQVQVQVQPQVTYRADSIAVSPAVPAAAFLQRHDAPIESPNGAPSPNNGFTELQEHAKLAFSRVRLMDNTLDILLDTFQKKYELNKELEKWCSKVLKSGSGSGSHPAGATDRASLEEDLRFLAESDQWVKDHMLQLDVCLSEKRRNMQIAGPLVDEKQEKRKEDEQERKIARIARKMEDRTIKWEKKEERRKEKEKEKEMLEHVEMNVM